MKKVMKSLTYRKYNRRSNKKKNNQSGSGYTVSVEKGSIAGMPVYTGYDDQAPPAYVGGLTNTENSNPMVGGRGDTGKSLQSKMKKDLNEIMNDIKNSLNIKGGAKRVTPSLSSRSNHKNSKSFRFGL